MIVRKLIFAGSATALGLGLTGIPVAAFADDSPSIASPVQPTVTQSAGTFTVTLPGVGSLSFGVDPTSGALTALTVTPAPGSGFTAGTPVTTEEGVQVLFTGASGSQLLEVTVDQDEAVTEVRAEAEAPPPTVQAGGTPGDDRNGDPGNNAGSGDDRGGATTTTTPGAPTVGDDNGTETGSGDGRPSTTTSTTVPGPASTPDNGGDQNGTFGSGSDGGRSGPGTSGGSGSGGSGSGDGGSGSGGPGGGSGSGSDG